MSSHDTIHEVIAKTFRQYGDGPETDNALQLCGDSECSTCAAIICPHGEPLHFHHDGCPACARMTTPTPASAAAQATPITDKAWSEYDGMRMTSTELRIIMARLERENADLAAALEECVTELRHQSQLPEGAYFDIMKRSDALIAAHKKGAGF